MINRSISNGWLRALCTRWVTLLCMLCLASIARAADKQNLEVYTGTLGKASVVFELDLTTPTEVTGRYFYQKYHRDLALAGSLTGSTLTLKEGSVDDSNDHDDTTQPMPDLTLKKDAQGGWQGDWKSAGKSEKITLVKAKVAAPAAGAEAYWKDAYASSLYDYLRIKDLPLKEGKKEDFMGHGLTWWTEPVSKLSMPEITSGYGADELKRINVRLRGRLWDEVTAYNACMLQASGSDGDFTQTVTPQLLSPGIVSISVTTSYYCGGAHPDAGDSPLNLDAHTGEALALEDVLWIGKSKPFHFEENDISSKSPKSTVDFDAFSDYRQKSFSPWLVEQFKTLYPQDMAAPKTDDDCDFTDTDVWNFPSWYFTPKGLYLGPVFARVMRSCEGPAWPVLPYSMVKAHPGGVKVDLPN